ncbi:hypothetical protein [Nocardioides terrisoli]|uniref:hypothetical protein n=1 Tax=Nocardioides terrisoli TaxID=3388267 RepID=UPI00287B8490|nr:hypothetical protein [Nocardioides marmorisolisilvae]
MARDHARILTAIWRDPDFRALDVGGQHAYLALVSQEALTYAGVLDYRPGRIAALSKGNTASKVERAIRSLAAARFVVLDEQTEELLARTYVRYDGVMDRVNMGKAVGRAIDKIVSLNLRAAVLTELGRHYAEKPTLAGWDGLAEVNADAMNHVTAMASTIPLPMASGMATAMASGKA